jgi:glycosyltransferase involved in cell wall biosynthesis
VEAEADRQASSQPAIRLSVVLPALDEQEAVGQVVREIAAALCDWAGEWETIVVDDASADGTAREAERAGATVIRRAERGGTGAAIKTGLRAARGQWAAILDADATYDPAALPRLLELLPAYDLVNGVRDRDHGQLAWLRLLAKRLLTRVAEWISGKRIIDLNTGMKVFKRNLALSYLWALPDGFSAVSSLTLAFVCDGRQVAYVPVPYRPRIGRSKFHPLRDTSRYLATIFRLVLYFRPLRVFLPLAAIILAAALPLTIWHVLFSPLGLADADVMLFGLAALAAMFGLLAELIVAQRRFP